MPSGIFVLRTTAESTAGATSTAAAHTATKRDLYEASTVDEACAAQYARPNETRSNGRHIYELYADW